MFVFHPGDVAEFDGNAAFRVDLRIQLFCATQHSTEMARERRQSVEDESSSASPQIASELSGLGNEPHGKHVHLSLTHTRTHTHAHTRAHTQFHTPHNLAYATTTHAIG